ncbi:hypothetical protein RBSWK_01155 [Rhodopirellula baltica SWK14]|uniref:Uncharacterized protein n=1 Tax=Rhodopirellula baltica SWK14 TaxID=993516 RepID=L7CMK3_RHOBT|nr:hypothetical protein RBSWK_01155 [Rhodopirellula baltica SWK14]
MPGSQQADATDKKSNEMSRSSRSGRIATNYGSRLSLRPGSAKDPLKSPSNSLLA